MRHEDDEYAASLRERLASETRVAAQYGAEGVTQTVSQTSVRKSDVVEIQKHLERIEAKLDRLMQALSAGAVGDWR